MSASIARVRAFYDRTVAHEAQRLDENVYRRLERDMTVRLVERHAPAGARILDVGGGPGAYLEPLVTHGFAPWLVDLSDENVRLARARANELGLVPVEERVRQANATDLGAFAGESFDAALAAGPFYHLVDPADQRQALAELARVVRRGGTIVCSVLPRLHPLRYLLREGSEESWRCLERLDCDRLLDEGRYANPVDDPLFFTDAQTFRPSQFCALVRTAGLEVIDVVSAEGFCAFLDVPLAGWITDEARYLRLLDLVERTARDPEMLGAAEHLLVVAKKV